MTDEQCAVCEKLINSDCRYSQKHFNNKHLLEYETIYYCFIYKNMYQTWGFSIFQVTDHKVTVSERRIIDFIHNAPFIKLRSQIARSHAGDGKLLVCSHSSPGAVWQKRGCHHDHHQQGGWSDLLKDTQIHAISFCLEKISNTGIAVIHFIQYLLQIFKKKKVEKLN